MLGKYKLAADAVSGTDQRDLPQRRVELGIVLPIEKSENIETIHHVLADRGSRFMARLTIWKRTAVTLSVMISCAAGPLSAQEVTGKPSVIDGDTIEIAGQALRLAGADAPPADWICGPADRKWRCGMEATMALEFEIAYHWVTCLPLPLQRGGVTLARCKVGPYNLAARTVLAGWAMAVGGNTFEEDIARRAGKGIWRDGYVPPPRWRHARKPQ